jgi:hypothetical protein
VIAFFLGVIGLFIGFGVGEGSGLVAGFVTLGVYCFLCQFLLSRKNVNAYRKDWPVMLALDAVWLFILCVMFLKEKQNVIQSQGPAILLATCGATYLGSVVASLTAKRTVARS